MLARSTGMRDYDTPKKPEDTPPVINPGAKQENSHDSGKDDSEEAPSNDRPAGSQITGGPTTKPTRLSFDVATLSYTPLATRSSNVVPIGIQVRTYHVGIDELPTTMR